MKKIALAILMGVGVALIGGCTKSSTTNNDPTSSNGSGEMVWTLQPGINNTPNDYITSLASNGSVFVAIEVPENNNLESGAILSSTDGITWTARSEGSAFNLRSVIWAHGLFVTVGDSGTILTSPDGITWTARSSGTTARLSGVIWGSNKYLAYGIGQQNIALSSPDGKSWTIATLNFSYPDYSYIPNEAIAWGNSKFVTIGNDSIYTSTDGLTWTSSYQNSLNVGGSIYSIIWADSQFIAAANNLLTSPDGITWKNRGELNSNISNGLTWGNGKFIVAAAGNNLTSIDGVTWNVEEALPDAVDGYLLAYGAGKFVAVNSYTDEVLTSP